MNKRVDQTQRLGVNAFENFTINQLTWIFREHPTMDYGIDATIEQVINGNPTGKMIALQVKSGRGNVTQNAAGQWVYYMSNVHHDYWLSHALPVIFIFFDNIDNVLYWKPIRRSSMTITESRYKITFSNQDVCSKNMQSELNEIIDFHQSEEIVPDLEIENMTSDDILDYSSSLLIECQKSLQSCRTHIENLDKSYNTETGKASLLLQKGIKDSKLIRNEFAHKLALACNIASTRIKAEIPIVAQTCTQVLHKMEGCMSSLKSQNNELYNAVTPIIFEEWAKMQSAIHSLISILNKVYLEYNQNNENNPSNLVHAYRQFAMVIDKYKSELEDMNTLIAIHIKQNNIA